MAVIEKNSEHYVGYDYMEFRTEGSKASMYIDNYAHFGWKPDENADKYLRRRNENTPKIEEKGSVLLRFKRDRKIVNKPELIRLQKNFEDCMKQINELEKSKTVTATKVSVSIGVVGLIFMAGSTFAVTASPPIIWLCVLLAVPGFAGWISPYFVYKSIVAKRTEKVNPLIEDKYDEAYEICEKGSKLLN